MGRQDVEINQTTDRPILEELKERGNLNPIHIAEGINRHRNYVGTRLKLLVKHGLVNNMGHGLYQITDRGRAYLDGKIDVEDLATD